MEQHFYGLTLTTNQIEIWDPEAGTNYHPNHQLVIKSVLLGPEAVDNELNIVLVTTVTWGSPTFFIPIKSVTESWSNPQISLDLFFSCAPVSFALVQGNGPVHIIGTHLIKNQVQEELDEETLTADSTNSEEEEEEEEMSS